MQVCTLTSELVLTSVQSLIKLNRVRTHDDHDGLPEASCDSDTKKDHADRHLNKVGCPKIYVLCDEVESQPYLVVLSRDVVQVPTSAVANLGNDNSMAHNGLYILDHDMAYRGLI